MKGLSGAPGGARGGAWGPHRRAVAESLAREDKCLNTIRVRFEWDPRKADANLRAHGIRFAEAVTALEDAFALTREDPDAVGEQPRS
jgi:Ribonuclease toxin, BrnT, of type II toxin-antitoxin system